MQGCYDRFSDGEIQQMFNRYMVENARAFQALPEQPGVKTKVEELLKS